MSTCISMHGEYDSHEIDDEFTCRLCGVFDEDGALAEIDRLRAAAATHVHNHAPYRPVCNERRLPSGQLRGACLNDDGSER